MSYAWHSFNSFDLLNADLLFFTTTLPNVHLFLCYRGDLFFLILPCFSLSFFYLSCPCHIPFSLFSLYLYVSADPGLFFQITHLFPLPVFLIPFLTDFLSSRSLFFCLPLSPNVLFFYYSLQPQWELPASPLWSWPFALAWTKLIFWFPAQRWFPFKLASQNDRERYS